jgi:hypothetical protein
MKTVVILVLAMIANPCAAKGKPAMLPLDTNVLDFALPDSAGRVVHYHSFLGKNRIVLVAVPQGATPGGADYLQHAWKEQQELKDRDTVVLMVVPAKGALAQEPSVGQVHVLHDPIGTTMVALGATGDAAVSYLVGKDRGVKRRGAGFLPASALFAAIDSMPMRQREMRERR